MTSVSGKRALVLGLDASGEAAALLLRRQGADVHLVDVGSESWNGVPEPDLVVLSAGCATTPPLAREFASRGVTVMAERELAFQHSLCLHVAVTGASGKTTTSELIAHLLRSAGRRVGVADGVERPACALVESTRELDLLVHGVEPGELEHFHFFRPVVAVLLNLPGDGAEPGGASGDERNGSWPLLFARQQSFDWAIIQSEALNRLRAMSSLPPGKQITFSTEDTGADLGCDRGLLVSRLPGWTGPLWDMARGRMLGPGFAEDALAALAVGRVLRVPLEEMTSALGRFQPPAGCVEILGEVAGVRFIHDGRSTNPGALAKALAALAPTPPAAPFIWLIAGGETVSPQVFDIGPLLTSRVRHAFLFGAAAAALRRAWQLFTPCTVVTSLLDAANRSVEQAAGGEVILFSPACPSGGTRFGPRPGADVFREVFETRHRPASGPVHREARRPVTGTSSAEGMPFPPPWRLSPTPW